MPRFSVHIGIDYSGAATPETPLRGIRVATGREGSCALESPGKNWSRRGTAEWLLEILENPEPAIAGIDHGFSFPLAWFDAHGIPKNWDDFLESFCHEFPADKRGATVDDFRKNPEARHGCATWRRSAEIRCKAKSVFHFGVPGSVAKSTHAGIPWLRFLRIQLGPKIHFWPFDGFEVPDGRHVIAEVYPSIWRGGEAPAGTTPDESDALTIARTLRESDFSGRLDSMLQPGLAEAERSRAKVEGWILGVP